MSNRSMQVISVLTLEPFNNTLTIVFITRSSQKFIRTSVRRRSMWFVIKFFKCFIHCSRLFCLFSFYPFVFCSFFFFLSFCFLKEIAWYRWNFSNQIFWWFSILLTPLSRNMRFLENVCVYVCMCVCIYVCNKFVRGITWNRTEISSLSLAGT